MIELIKKRNYQIGDYTKIMDFLREMYEINKNQHCWLPSRWEYAEHLVNPLYVERGDFSWENFIQIWEEGEKIVGVAHKENGPNAFIQIRAGYRHLEKEMIKWIEENIAEFINNKKKERKIIIWSNDSDTYRNNLLKNHGFKKSDVCNYLNVQDLDKEYKINVPEGYIIRSMSEDIDLVKRYNVINKAFHPEDDYKEKVPHSIFQIMKAPMYRPDLDIVIEDKDGYLASSCIVWYDERLKIGMFEPVGTHPDHLRKGLGRVVLLEGLKRLKNLGARKAYVESYGDERYSFYKSAGFISYDRDYPWVKTF